MTRVLLVPDKFKSTLSSREAAGALSAGILDSFPGARISPLVVSDGGEGFIEALEQAEEIERHSLQVPGPAGRITPAHLGVSKKNRRIYIESCQATGFHLLKETERDPLKTSSEGLADLLHAALTFRPAEIFIGLGSSATCDAGIPAAGRFGYQFLDTRGHAVAPQVVNLETIATILPPEKKFFGDEPVKIYAVADVANPPVGEKGGVKVYSPQKGAGLLAVEKLENGMKALLRAMEKSSGQDLSSLPGGGAGGCLGLGLYFFFGAQITEGSAFIFKKLELEKRILESEIVITGEGSFDEQSFSGKITGAIIRAAQESHKKIILVTGRTKIPDFLMNQIEGLFSVEQLVKKGGLSGKEESRQALITHGRSIGQLISKL